MPLRLDPFLPRGYTRRPARYNFDWSDTTLNPLVVLNLTVVGGYIVPASNGAALFLIEGGLIDVSNGFLYASMESEGEGHTWAPTFSIKDKDAIERAKQDAVKRFGPELLLRLRNVRASFDQAASLTAAPKR